jgi:hypothetical protein
VGGEVLGGCRSGGHPGDGLDSTPEIDEAMITFSSTLLLLHAAPPPHDSDRRGQPSSGGRGRPRARAPLFFLLRHPSQASSLPRHARSLPPCAAAYLGSELVGR